MADEQPQIVLTDLERSMIREIEMIKANMLLVMKAEHDKDSIEIGTAGKGGCIKVYGDFAKPDEFRTKLDEAVALRNHMKDKLVEVQ